MKESADLQKKFSRMGIRSRSLHYLWQVRLSGETLKRRDNLTDVGTQQLSSLDDNQDSFRLT